MQCWAREAGETHGNAAHGVTGCPRDDDQFYKRCGGRGKVSEGTFSQLACESIGQYTYLYRRMQRYRAKHHEGKELSIEERAAGLHSGHHRFQQSRQG